MINLLTDGLAIARMVRLAQQDSITEPARKHVQNWLYQRQHWKLMELLDCPWCLSVWLAAGVTAGRAFAPRFTDTVCVIMAASEVASIATVLAERADPDS